MVAPKNQSGVEASAQHRLVQPGFSTPVAELHGSSTRENWEARPTPDKKL
jgi:hypothetical protein